MGELWRHHNLRIAYVAQHSMHHLEECGLQSPLDYIRDRFAAGRDAEDGRKASLALSPEEEAERGKRGAVEAICGRRMSGKELFYEVKKVGRKEKDNSWEPLTYLQAAPAYVMKLVKDYDERMKALQSGMEARVPTRGLAGLAGGRAQTARCGPACPGLAAGGLLPVRGQVRPLTAAEVKAHLADFGIGEELALSRIKGFSGGQKSRLVLAAAMWSRPHLLTLDEPTNYVRKPALCACALRLRPRSRPPVVRPSFGPRSAARSWTGRASPRWATRCAASQAPCWW